MKKYKEILFNNLRSYSKKDICNVDICESLDGQNKISVLDLFIPISMYAQFLKESEAIEFIKKQVKDFSFNYLISNEIKYPNDLDDTCFGLQALFLNNEEIDERYILKLLDLESQPGGPYYTWYVKDEKWLDIDPAVNANLLYTLSLLGIELPKTLEYMKSCFKENELKSKYYPTELITLYYLSKYVYTSGNEKIKELILTFSKNYQTTVLYEELLNNLILAYLNGEVDKDFIKRIKNIIEEDSYPSIPFCLDHKTKDSEYFVCSNIFTKLFIYEFLSLTEKDSSSNEIKYPFDIEKQKKIIKRIFEKSSAKNELLKIYSQSGSFKALSLPQLFGYSLKKELNSKEIKRLEDFSIGLYFGWMGYTVLDDILDGDRDCKEIPLSFILNNLHVEYMNKVLNKKQITDYLKILNNCNEHYDWETKEMYFDLSSTESINKIKKSSPSYSYILGRLKPFIFAMSMVPTFLNLEEKKIYSKVFEYKMIVDQLNDDLHDWESDFEKGILTYPVNLFLQEVDIDLLKNGLTDDLKIIFWQKVAPVVLSDCDNEYEKIRLDLESVNNVFIINIVEKALLSIQNAKSELASIERISDYLK
jgi:hypothetical protein